MSDFKIEKVLGKGSFGSVYLVTRKKDKKIYAIKTVILEKLNKKEQENSVNEVRILASVNHPNVIGYKEAFWNDKESSLNIVMEYADDGDLQTKIQKMRKEGGMFTENIIWSYSIQMIEGLKALHDKKIMHRDLKSANIFLVKENHQCKLGDMNVSKVIKDKVLLTQTGTPYYASPEVWNDSPYSYKSDLWSIGCVIYELCALHPPFNGKDLDELYVNVCKGKVERINKIYSDDLWKMILMLLQVDVKKRVDCDSFLNSKLIMRKKKEMKEFNYLENKIGENMNSGILLSTIKFSNINEIKAQLPKNKNYNDELSNMYINDINKLSSKNFGNKINNNIIKNSLNSSNNNKFIKNISNILSNINNNSNKNLITNSIHYNNKNNIVGNGGKNILNIDHIINKSSEKDKDLETKIKNNSKERKSNNINYYDMINFHTENEEQKNEKKKKFEKEKLLKELEYNKLLDQLKIQKEILKIKDTENEIRQRNYLRELMYISNDSSDLSNKINFNNNTNNNSNNKEKIKTEEFTNYIKIKHNTNRNNKSIESIPTSIKKTKSNRLKMKKLKNNKSIDNIKNKYIKKEKNISYLKTNEPIGIKKYKYGIPIYNNLTKERTKTPITCDKSSHLENDIYDNYNYYYYKNYKRIKRKEYSENQKSEGNLRINPKNNITEIYDNSNIYSYKNNKASKSNTNLNINLNPNLIENYHKKNKIFKKNINTYRKEPLIAKLRPISASSKRMEDFPNINNNFTNKRDYIQTTQDNKNNQNYSKYYLDNIDINKYKVKTMENSSITNINNNQLIPNAKNKNIKHNFTCTNSELYYNEKFPTIVDNNNVSNISHKKNNIKNYSKKKNDYSYEKNVKKLNNKVRHYTYKRSYDENAIRTRKKRKLLTYRDLTEPELMMILNPIKIKENNRNNSSKNMNITLNENISKNSFLKQKKQVEGLSNNNHRCNQYYNCNYINNNNENLGNMEKNNGPQVFNNFYSINNIGNNKIPIKVINVFN